MESQLISFQSLTNVYSAAETGVKIQFYFLTILIKPISPNSTQYSKLILR